MPAIKKTILTCATAHLFFLLYHAITLHDYRFINIFRVLDLQMFYAPLQEGFFNFILSWLLTSALIFFYWWRLSKKSGSN